MPTTERSGGNRGAAPSSRPAPRDVTGILLLDKPGGMTSNRALQQAKRLFCARKAGHTGSLDPLASGMLPLCFGQATKVSGWLLDADKTYEVEATIGERTDTADADGEVIETSSITSLERLELEQALTVMLGETWQVPPMYSALKHQGKRLYELAREGKVVERPARQITIHSLELIHFDPQKPVFRVCCSKGTYVRTLVETIAEKLGTLAHVSMLRRTLVAPFAAHPMVTLEELEARAGDSAALDRLLLPPDQALPAFPEVRLAASDAFYLGHGHAVTCPVGTPEGPVRLYDHNGAFMGIGVAGSDGTVAPKRLFGNVSSPAE